MSIFKVFGWITIALGLVTLCGIAANLTRSTLGGHNLTPLTSVVVLSISIGLGLVFHQKWAAALFAILLGGAAFWIGTMSVLRVPMPWLILNVGLACALLAPSALVILRWSQLSRK